MIEGNHVYIRLMEIADVKYKVKWVNDDEVRKTLLFFDYPISVLGTENWLRKVSHDPTRKDFIVCLKSDNTPIGFTGLRHIDYKNSKAESFMCIGAKEQWGKGYGYDIKKAVLKYSFESLNLNKIYSHHLVHNNAMIKINLKLGGKQEGILREDVYSEGKLTDRVVISILKKEMLA